MRDQESGIWTQFISLLDSLPEDSIAITVYVLGTLIVLWCWYSLVKRLPTPIGQLAWIIVFAILVTPTISEGPNSAIAPAIFGLIFGVLTKDSPLIWSNLALISFVIGIGSVLGYCWTKISTKNQTHQKNTRERTSPL